MTGEILFLAHRLPYPPDRGDKIRSWNVLKAIAALAPTHVCGLIDPADDSDAARAAIEPFAASFHAERPAYSRKASMVRALFTGQPASVCAFACPALQAQVSRVISERPISAIYAFSGQMAQFVPEILEGRRFVMDFVDMDSAKFASFGADHEGLEGWANRMEARRLLAFEKRTAARADISLFVSAPERILFQSVTGIDADKVAVLENGIDLDLYDPGLSLAPLEIERPLIVFTGQMDYRPNADAVEGFARETMPLIRAIYPAARFAIVGRSPTAAVKALSELPGVLVTGEVPETRPWLAAADVVVAPLKLARGIQNKVLEAMAMGKAVVASPSAAQGIDAEAALEIVVADGAQAEARAVIALLAEPEQAAAIGRAARARMEARYSWRSRMAPLSQILGLDA